MTTTQRRRTHNSLEEMLPHYKGQAESMLNYNRCDDDGRTITDELPSTLREWHFYWKAMITAYTQIEDYID